MKKNLTLLFGLFLLLSAAHAQTVDFTDTPKLIVKGEASIFKPSDQMKASLGVVTTGENSSAALNENKQKIGRVEANLKAAGLDSVDYQTGEFRIRPVYQKSDKDSSEKTDKIKYYEALNSIRVKTTKITLADKIIDAAVQGGANQIRQVEFDISNPQAYSSEAIKAAAVNALTEASNLADAMNVKLKRILSISLDFWHQSPNPVPLSNGFKLMGGHNEEEESNQMIAGNAEIRAVINATFEIGQ